MDSGYRQNDLGTSISQNNSIQAYASAPLQGTMFSLPFDNNCRSSIMDSSGETALKKLVSFEKGEGVPKKRVMKFKTEKKEPKERSYKCNRCNKSYLSYPALYTHTKLKHVFSKDNSSITNGRMRGRPKKPIVSLQINI